MKLKHAKSGLLVQVRGLLLVLPLTMFSGQLSAETADANPPADAAGVTPLPSGACPLNSGGPSLLGTRWRLYSVYGNQVPPELEITMEVAENDLKGFGGCNDYDANFQRVGHTGFKINKIAKGSQGCPIMRTGAGQPTINVGDWEGGYIRTLQRAGSVEQVGNTLQFYNRSGEPSVIFARKYGDGPTEAAPEATPPDSKPVPETPESSK